MLVIEPVLETISLHRRAVPELDTGCGRLLCEEGVEPPALSHEDDGSLASSLEPAAVAGTKHEAVDDVLDDRRDVAGSVL